MVFLESINKINILRYLFCFSIFITVLDRIEFFSNTSLYTVLQLPVFLIIILILLTKKIIIKKNIYFFLLYLISFCVFISTIFAIDIENSFKRTIDIFEYIIFSIVFYHLLYYIYDDYFLDKIVKTISFIGGLGSSTLVTDYFNLTSYHSILLEDYTGVRQIGIFGEANFAAAQIAVFMPFTLYCIFNTKSRFHSFFFTIIFTINISAIILTGSRMGFILIFSIIILLLLLDYKKIINTKFLLIIIFIFIIIFFIFSDYYVLLASRFSRIFAENSIDGSTSIRLELLKNGFKIFLKNPIVGIGIDNYRYEIKNYLDLNKYAHNTYLEFLTGVGFLGFLIYIFLLFKIGYDFFVIWKKNKNDVFLYFLISYIVLIISFLFLSNLSNRFFWMLFLPLSMAANDINN